MPAKPATARRPPRPKGRVTSSDYGRRWYIEHPEKVITERRPLRIRSIRDVKLEGGLEMEGKPVPGAEGRGVNINIYAKERRPPTRAERTRAQRWSEYVKQLEKRVGFHYLPEQQIEMHMRTKSPEAFHESWSVGLKKEVEHFQQAFNHLDARVKELGKASSLRGLVWSPLRIISPKNWFGLGSLQRALTHPLGSIKETRIYKKFGYRNMKRMRNRAGQAFEPFRAAANEFLGELEGAYARYRQESATDRDVAARNFWAAIIKPYWKYFEERRKVMMATFGPGYRFERKRLERFDIEKVVGKG